MGESPWLAATLLVAFALDCLVFHLRPAGLLILRPPWWHLRLGRLDDRNGSPLPLQALQTLQTVRMPDRDVPPPQQALQPARSPNRDIQPPLQALQMLQPARVPNHDILIFYAVGSATATVQQVMGNVARLRQQRIGFSLFLAHYDKMRQHWLKLTGEAWYRENVDGFCELAGYKLKILQRLLQERRLDVARYHWVWALDEDVDLVQADIPRLLQLAGESGALLASPAYQSNWHDIMVRNPSCLFRFTNFLEVTFPLIRPEVLLKLLDKEVCQHCLHETTVWGLDYIWCAWSARAMGFDRNRACAVVDAAPVVHRDFKTLEGKYRKGKHGSKKFNMVFHEQALMDRQDVLARYSADSAQEEMDLECVSTQGALWQSGTKQAAAPAGPQRWAICIVGQLSRLEVESKLQNLFLELAKKGAEVHAYFVLEMHSTQFSNRDTDYGVNSTNCSKDPMRLQALKERFWPYYKVGQYPRHNRSLIKEMNLSRWRKYQQRFPNRKQKLANDITQMQHIASCEALIRKHEGKKPYTDILRIRDNAVVTLPFPSDLVRFPGIAVKGSQSWAGLNDKAMYTARQFLTPALTSALQLAMQINEDTVPEHLLNMTRRIKNSEMLLATALKGYPVLQLPSFKMVLVDGRCYGLRKFCLVPPWKDMPPPLPGLWAPFCNETLNISVLPAVLPKRRKRRKDPGGPVL